MRSTVLSAAVLVLLTAMPGCGAVKQSAYSAAVASRRAGAGLSAREATAEGRRVAYLERDGAEPALVLLHGFGAQKDAWLDLVAEMPPGRRVLVPDLSGHGGSARGPGAYDAQRLTDEAEAWLDAVAPGPVVLGGNSMGGEIATRLALARPTATVGLVLLAPAGVASPDESALADSLRAGQNPLVPTTRAAFDRLVDFAYEVPPDLPGLARDVLVADYAARAPFLRQLFAALGPSEAFAARLPEVAAPALVIWGAQDRVLDASAAPVWAAALGDAEVAVLPGVGHVPMMEASAETARRIEAFLDRVAPVTR